MFCSKMVDNQAGKVRINGKQWAWFTQDKILVSGYGCVHIFDHRIYARHIDMAANSI